MFQQSLLPGQLFLAVAQVKEGLISQGFWKAADFDVINLDHNNTRVASLQTSVQSDVELFSAEIAAHVVF